MGCTSKVMGVAAILKMSMTDNQLLQQKMTYNKNDIVDWSPTTEKHIVDGLTVYQLCEAVITVSDNTAMNLLLKQMGGLQGLNAFARSIADNHFRADHDWPKEAESGGLGNLEDSTTPAAMARSLQRLAFGDVLQPAQRAQLIDWLKNNTTGNARIRAGVPKGWIVGDKTGTGSAYGTTNDIGIIWPPQSAPIIVVIYFTTDRKDAVKRDDVVASATRIVIEGFAKTDKHVKLNS